jgi:hypothetical protein
LVLKFRAAFLYESERLMTAKKMTVRIVYAIVIVLAALVCGFRLVTWSFNRLSPEFRVAAKSAFDDIKRCEHDEIDSRSYQTCIGDAKKDLVPAKAVMKSGNEHRAFYLLQTYLEDLENCARGHKSAPSGESPECRQMIERRHDLSIWLGK